MKAKKWIVMVVGMALFLGMVLTACGKRETEAVYQNAFFSMELQSGVSIEEGENQNWEVLYQGAPVAEIQVGEDFSYGADLQSIVVNWIGQSAQITEESVLETKEGQSFQKVELLCEESAAQQIKGEKNTSEIHYFMLTEDGVLFDILLQEKSDKDLLEKMLVSWRIVKISDFWKKRWYNVDENRMPPFFMGKSAGREKGKQKLYGRKQVSVCGQRGTAQKGKQLSCVGLPYILRIRNGRSGNRLHQTYPYRGLYDDAQYNYCTLNSCDSGNVSEKQEGQ